MKIILILLIFSACTSNPHSRGENNLAVLDDYFDLVETKDKAMGSILISESGHEVYGRSYGHSNVERKTKNTLDTPFHIGSISKTLTAIIILRLVEEKKLSLDEKLFRFYPQIINSKTISVKQLLKHRSGLENFTDQKTYLSYKNKEHSQKEMIALLAKLKSVFEPGSKYEYSNSNYVLLSYIAEKVSKKSFSDLVSYYLVKPLNLKNTYFYQQKLPRSDEAISYSFSNGWKEQQSTHESVPMGAGAIASSARDLTKIFSSLFSDELISKELFLNMTDLKDSYGYGLISIPFYEDQALGHTGGIDNYRSLAMYFKTNNTVFVHLSNASEILFNDMNIAALSIYYKKPFTLPDFKTIEVSVEDLAKYEGTYGDKNFPFKIKVFIKNSALYAQANGQSEFLLQAIAKDIFEFPSASIKMEFNSEKGLMHFTQGEKFVLKKE